MSELSKYLVEQILLEDGNPINKTVVIYVGRFQPFHKGHNGTYQHLVKKFGKDNVFIGTSNKTDNLKSPFNFKEKVKIMSTMFGIPSSKIHLVKNPYKPTEILKKFEEETTAFITVVGEKDKARLGGKYFKPYKGETSVGYRDRGYVYAAPTSGGGVSGTQVRNGLSTGTDDQKQKFFKDTAFTKFNKTIFNLITSKLNEGIFIPKERIEEWMLNESSGVFGQGDTDDGPNTFFPNYDVFKSINTARAAKIGYEIVNMITTKELEDYYEHPTYPNGPVPAVTPFPAGVIGAKTATNQVDIYSNDAYSKWYTHVTRKASLVGYSVVSDPNMKLVKKQSTDGAKSDKDIEKEFENSVNEIIKLPVEIGDTLLMGKFKNKKVVVKTIGKDEHGLPTINGRKVVTFRYGQKAPNVFEQIVELAGTSSKCEKCNHSWELEADDSEKYLCHSCGWDSQKQEYDFDAFDSWREKMGLTESEDIEERGGLTPAQKLRRKASMAGKKTQTAIKRRRTMKRRKSYSKLVKIAYKMAYRQVYDEFKEKLFPDTPKSELTIIQKKQIHKYVLRKKGRVMKRAKFRFLPGLRQKENDKFTVKTEMAKSDLGKVEKFADKTLNPVDVEFTKHFFDRVNDTRNGKEISAAELIGFFKRLSRNKKEFKDFLSNYKEIMVKDGKTKINIPFVKQANKIIAKTVMRTANWTQHKTPEFKFENKKETPMKDSIDKLVEDMDTALLNMVFPNKKVTENVSRSVLTENINESNLLMEGGAYGHMSHPFDTDINLTFGQLKDIVNRALEGTLEFTREKTDGQALAVSWVGGRLVAARNKGHLKNKGENALDINGIATKFAGRGELEKAYNFAMKDLSDSIKGLSEKQRNKVFKEGACFMNLEVIYPTSVNVIPYGQPLLVFHGTMEFNIEGVAIGENADAGRILAGMIKQINKDVQDNYTIQGPPVMKLPASQNLTKRRSQYNSQISKLQKEFSLKDTDGVADYHQAWWSQWVDKNSPSSLDNKTKMGLVKRWAFYDKSFRLDKKNLTDEKVMDWAKKIDKQDQVKISKINVMKFEQIFLGLGAEVLEFASSALTVNPDAAVRDMKKRIDKTIKDVKKSGDPKKIEKLKLELGRLQSIGGSKKIVPNEGIVFVYNGHTMKLTGTFASVNQILGIFF